MQTRLGSAIETVTSTAIGYVVSILTQAAVFPLFDIETTTKEHFGIAAIFTVVSIIRGYLVRRGFNYLTRLKGD